MAATNEPPDLARDRAVVDRLAEVWASVVDLCRALSPQEWLAPTECPGWTVQDNVAHLVGIESVILGMPTPEVDVSDRTNVRNDFGRINEQWVEHYRSRSGVEVLAEFERIAARRLDDLRGLDEAGFGADAWTPVGPGTVRDLLPFRVFDSWVHEQDMRRAVGRPGDLETPAGRFCFRRMTAPIGMVVGKRVKPPDGATVEIDATAWQYGFAMRNGRAQEIDVPEHPTVRVVTTADALVRLVNGRGDANAIYESGDVRVDGDEDLGRAIILNLNTMI